MDVPTSTYRLQFNSGFTFEQANAIVDYLSLLGISDCYSSPLLQAKKGSVHCYDVVNHSRIHDEIGTVEGFRAFSDKLKAKGLGLLLDIVPNHVGVGENSNGWWIDVLQNGKSSHYAKYFDVNWDHPINSSDVGKLMVPFLGNHLNQIVESGELQLHYHEEEGAFWFHYYALHLPIDTRTYDIILDLVLFSTTDQSDEANEMRAKLAHIKSSLSNINRVDRESVASEAKKVHQSLKDLTSQSNKAAATIKNIVEQINGKKRDSSSFATFYKLLAEQNYRPCYWRAASDELNYRRFFEITELMGLRVEDEEVFNESHKLIFQLVQEGRINGLRIDHPDGLFDPEGYLARLHSSVTKLAKKEDFYVVVEKILEGSERLISDWKVKGTTGYEFMSFLHGVLVAKQNEESIKSFYHTFGGHPKDVDFHSILFNAKKRILETTMGSELTSLACSLHQICLSEGSGVNFTQNQFNQAIKFIVSAFPVYRTYITQTNKPTSVEQDHVKHSISLAKAKKTEAMLYIEDAVFDYIQKILLCDGETGLSGDALSRRRSFISRFQQVTGPVMAKGLEDTAFYTYFPLVSLNEVGGDPATFGVSIEEFHKENQFRAKHWPLSMTSTSTHDTKRSEDVRCRIDVISEIPDIVQPLFKQWSKQYKTETAQISNNDEYLLFQTLIGAWPYRSEELTQGQETFINRIKDYMIKAIKEAKVHTNWILPNSEYEDHIKGYIDALLRNSSFLESMNKLQAEHVSLPGKLNSLVHAILKLTSPGVPDIYQGTEMWDLSLVDPDNRRPVDYTLRAKLLEERVTSKSPQITTSDVNDDTIGWTKLFVLHKLLSHRKANSDLYLRGDYQGLKVSGKDAQHVLAFSRTTGNKQVVVVCGRHFANRRSFSEGTTVEMPSLSKTFRDVLSGAEFDSKDSLSVATLFQRVPFCVLESGPAIAPVDDCKRR